MEGIFQQRGRLGSFCLDNVMRDFQKLGNDGAGCIRSEKEEVIFVTDIQLETVKIHSCDRMPVRHQALIWKSKHNIPAGKFICGRLGGKSNTSLGSHEEFKRIFPGSPIQRKNGI